MLNARLHEQTFTPRAVEISATGFLGSQASVTILDNDVPAVTMSLAQHLVSESAGPQATSGFLLALAQLDVAQCSCGNQLQTENFVWYFELVIPPYLIPDHVFSPTNSGSRSGYAV